MKKRNTIGFWWERLGENHLPDPDIDGRIILKRSLKKQNCMAYIEVIWLRINRKVWFLRIW
jgi:hypothetical protein